MAKANNLKIAIDIRRNRIRLNQNVLDKIGDPEYVQLLVNPSSKKIVLMASIETKTPIRYMAITREDMNLQA